LYHPLNKLEKGTRNTEREQKYIKLHLHSKTEAPGGAPVKGC